MNHGMNNSNQALALINVEKNRKIIVRLVGPRNRTSILRSQPPGLAELTVIVKLTPKEPILKGISGKFNSGQLTAILGPSGAGKTSLLNVLTGFKTSGVTGKITLNGKECDIQKFRKQSCYIAQEFAILENLTTKETMLVAADLKLESRVAKEKKNGIVNELLELIGLEKRMNTLVSKLSGGEKKRLSIGLELLTNPPVMFFDEPTSGLDSSSAMQVISHLKSLAEGGRTVVCTIHQPSSRLFEMFDEVYLISNGQCLYSGSIFDMAQVFREAGFQCPNFYNRADFAIDIATEERSIGKDQLIARFRYNEAEKVDYLQDDDNEETVILQQRSPKTYETSVDVCRKDEVCLKKSYPQTTWKQFQVLFKRSLLCSMRDLLTVQIRVATHVVVGVLLGAMYYDVGNDADKLGSNVACTFFFLMFLFFANAMPCALAISSEIPVVLREHLNNWYSLKAYFFSKVTADIPLLIICPTVLLLPGYFMTNQPYDLNRFLQFWLICLLTTILGHNIGLLTGNLCINQQIGMFVVPSSNIPLVLFSGFFMKLSDVPLGFKWLTYISYFRYSFEGLMVTLYGSGRPNLKCSEIYCYFKSPKKFLNEINMDDSNVMYDIIALVLWIVLVEIFIFCSLKWRVHISK